MSLEDNLQRISPQDVQSEMAILGAILLDKDALPKAIEMLKPEHFYAISHAKIFKSICTLYNKETQVDSITVREELRRVGDLENVGGSRYLNELVTAVRTSANIEVHAEIVIEKYLQRSLIVMGNKLVDKCYDAREDVFDLLAQHESELIHLQEFRNKRGIGDMVMQIERTCEKLNKLQSGETTLFKTGYYDIDAKLITLPGDTIILGGRPSQGKSILASEIAENNAKEAPVLYFSYEMSEFGLVSRLITKHTGIPTNDLFTGRFRKDALDEGLKALAQKNLHFCTDVSLDVMQIRAMVLRYKMEHPDLQLVVLDYLQLIPPTDKKLPREQQVAAITRGIVQTGKQAEVVMMPLSQLRRSGEGRETKAPALSDLRESGSQEADADSVILVHRPEFYGEPTMRDGKRVSGSLIDVNLAKNRNGQVGVCYLGFDGQHMRINNLVKEQIEQVETKAGTDDGLPF